MQNTTLWRGLLGVEQTTIIEVIEYDEDTGAVIAHSRPSARLKPRCGKCRRPAPGYDAGAGRRRWRALDLGTIPTYIEADAPHVNCPEHGATVAWVPWARHGAGHTLSFDQQVAWLATQCSKSAACALMRIAWRTAGSIIERVWGETAARVDLFAGLARIGIDEISYKKGHKYLTVVICHDTGRLVWAAPGRDKATVRKFFDDLEASVAGRCQKITHVTADGAAWIADVVAEKCPQAVPRPDPFPPRERAAHPPRPGRREGWDQAPRAPAKEAKRGRGHPAADAPARPAAQAARGLKDSRYALWKNPEDLTEHQQVKLAWIAQTSPMLHRAYLLKEGLRTIFKLDHQAAAVALDKWVAWARRCRIPAFVKLQRTIVKHRDRILAAIEHGLSNGRIESMNQKIRLITRIAFGFRSPDTLIALAMLTLGGHRPVLPGRQ